MNISGFECLGLGLSDLTALQRDNAGKEKAGGKKRGEIFWGGKKSSKNRKVTEVKQFKNVKKKTRFFPFFFFTVCAGVVHCAAD